VAAVTVTCPRRTARSSGFNSPSGYSSFRVTVNVLSNLSQLVDVPMTALSLYFLVLRHLSSQLEWRCCAALLAVTLTPFCMEPAVCVRRKLTLSRLTTYIYTGCNRRNLPNFGRVFLMLNYTEKTPNTYIQS
jgi:hypothetical protein